jgi:hypothetical protein
MLELDTQTFESCFHLSNGGVAFSDPALSLRLYHYQPQHVGPQQPRAEAGFTARMNALMNLPST